MKVAVLLVLMSAVIMFSLGAAHLLFTFWSQRLWPRDEKLKGLMEGSSPRISRETTMWKAWVGFNISHSMGALLFGFMFGYLVISVPEVFLSSFVLQSVGLFFLVAYCVLGRVYWFRVPFGGIAVATITYIAGLVAWYA